MNPPVTNNEINDGMVKSLYTTVTRDEGVSNPYSLQMILKPYNTNGMLKTYGITLEDMMVMPIDDLRIINSSLVKLSKETYEKMKESLGDDFQEE